MRRWLGAIHRNADVCCIGLIVVVLTAAFWPIFASWDKFPPLTQGSDWYKECTFNRLAREAILRDHQFALRTPYLGGGYPVVAYPEDSSLSPFFIATLLLGENGGLKLTLFIKLLVGGLGMYYLLRGSLGCLPGPAAFGSLAFGLAHWFHSKIGYGWLQRLDYYLIPLMMALFLDAVRGRRSVVLPSLVLAVALIHGKYVIPMSLLFLCLWGVPEVVRLRRGEIVLRFAFLQKLLLVVCLGCLLSMVKILPMLELLHENSRRATYADIVQAGQSALMQCYDPPALASALVRPEPPLRAGIGLGWLPVGLALLAAVLRPRATGRWTLLLVLFAWLCMGYRAPLDLWRLLWHLPVFGSIDKPAATANFFILMPVCVLTASVFGGTPRSRAGWAAYGSYLCAGAVAVSLLLGTAYRTNAANFTETLDLKVRRGPFLQAEGNGRWDTYRNLLLGLGSIDWNGDILLPEYAVPAIFFEGDGPPHQNEAYRGELWVAEGVARPSGTRFTPNVIEFDIRCTRPATVVINQNFHPAWRTSRGRLTSHEGLLAVADLPAGSRYTVRLRYLPPLFFIGLVVSAISLVGVGWLALKRLRSCGLRACLAGTDPPPGWSGREVHIAFGAWGGRRRLLAVLGLSVAFGVFLALGIPPLRADYMLRRAEVLRLHGATAPAAELCRRLLRSNPENCLAREVLAFCHYDEARWGQAAAQLEGIRQSGNLSPSGYACLARSYRELGCLADAEGVCREHLALAPYDRDARLWLRDLLKESAHAQSHEHARSGPVEGAADCESRQLPGPSDARAAPQDSTPGIRRRPHLPPGA